GCNPRAHFGEISGSGLVPRAIARKFSPRSSASLLKRAADKTLLAAPCSHTNMTTGVCSVCFPASCVCPFADRVNTRVVKQNVRKIIALFIVLPPVIVDHFDRFIARRPSDRRSRSPNRPSSTNRLFPLR